MLHRLTAACAGLCLLATGAAAAEYKVGLLLPFSGVYASLGEEIRDGFNLALEHYGDRLGGDTVVTLSEDTEVKPPVLADAIVDVSETGASLRANDLEVVDVVLESTPRLIANRAALRDPWKRSKVERLRMLLLGAIRAADRVGLMMDVPRDALPKVLELLPAIVRPTVSPLADENWFAVNTVLEERLVRDIVPELVEAGARGIVEYSLNKIVDG
ncbi:MAG: hypothetical protein D6729_03360 [Deltaproteobacteria bacterium]|nr:MAG: hypothetical protein D6729_03360 [Deltaproteobacteria bacterium]